MPQIKTQTPVLWVVTATGHGFVPFPARIFRSSQAAHKWVRDHHEDHPELLFSVAGCEVSECVELQVVA